MMKTSVAFLFAVLCSSCCWSLPQAPAKRVSALAAAAGSGVQESRELWRDERRSRDVPVRIYTPAVTTGRLPVVIFSHGIGEDRDSYAYIGRGLAANGFMAVHITHAGTDKAVLKSGYRKLYQATKDQNNWRNRPLDVSFVLDQLSKRPDVDMDRIAVAGHSAGAFTAFALAGVTGSNGENLRDDRVRVIIPMSMPRIEGVNYDGVHIPALNITGTCDSSIIYRTRPVHRRVPFEQTHATRQYLVTIDRVNHNTFSNATDPHHDTFLRLMIGFLRAWLLGDQNARAFFDEPGMVTVDKAVMTVERK